MATFSYFPTPYLPPHHPFPPPPPHAVPSPPPPPHLVPPPPPPPPRVLPPPPPHVLPPPPPDNGPTVVIVVFISFGGFFFAAFCFVAMWCLIKKRKQKVITETDIIRTDEHLRVKEAIVDGPNGPEVVVLSIEDDKHIQEDIIKNENVQKMHLHAKARTGEIVAAANDNKKP